MENMPLYFSPVPGLRPSLSRLPTFWSTKSKREIRRGSYLGSYQLLAKQNLQAAFFFFDRFFLLLFEFEETPAWPPAGLRACCWRASGPSLWCDELLLFFLWLQFKSSF